MNVWPEKLENIYGHLMCSTLRTFQCWKFESRGRCIQTPRPNPTVEPMAALFTDKEYGKSPQSKPLLNLRKPHMTYLNSLQGYKLAEMTAQGPQSRYLNTRRNPIIIAEAQNKTFATMTKAKSPPISFMIPSLLCS